MKAVRSAEGGQQGCVLATNGCCLPYQKALRKTQLKYPKAEFVIQADDTSIRAASADAENVHKALKANRKALCNTVSNVKKVKYFRPGGGVEGIPAEQLEMQGGELVGLKLVGVYLAPDTEAGRKWQRDNLSADFTARFSVLERVDQLRDDDKNHEVRQLRYSMMRCRSSTPHYWMRTMYPCVVRPVLEEVVEPALKKSFVLLAEAGHSPQELIDQAWAEAQQDGRFGGCGLGGHAQTADASFAAAVHVFAKEAAGTNTDRTVYGAASASASSFVVHHTQQISMAAVAGDAGNINKQARNARADWVKSPGRAKWVNDEASGRRTSS